MDNTSDVVGVAPGAPLIGVKVVGCNGFGDLRNVIKGVDWVTANARKPAIANISLSTAASKSFNQAVRNSASSGVFYSVAAGNDDDKACNYSPASAGAGTDNGIVTTAATDSSGREASFSNHGSCVDLWAPGVSILSTKLGGGTANMSGTSMAAPHVGGTAALYLSTHAAATPGAVERALKAASELTGKKSEKKRLIRLVYAGEF
jgi:subtilisin family serine protease